MMLSRLSLCIFVMLCLLLPVPVAAYEFTALRLKDGESMPLAETVEDLAKARIVYVGESHGNLSHHLAQLAVVQALHKAGVPVAVGLEMLPRVEQQAINRYIAKDMGEGEFVSIFNRTWNNWPAYRPIFDWCRENEVAMVGLNVPRAITRKVARQGFESLTQEELGMLPPIACVVHPEYEAFLRRVLGAHGQDEEQFQHFCEAQLVWDTAMAVHALDWLKEHPGTVMVVLTGSVHAWRPAMPTQAEKADPTLVQRVFLPEIEGRLEADELSAEDGDYLIQGLDQP